VLPAPVTADQIERDWTGRRLAAPVVTADVKADFSTTYVMQPGFRKGAAILVRYTEKGLRA
jgi:hypothetical protein